MSESILLDEAGLTVTTARFVTTEQTFALRNIASVKFDAKEIPRKSLRIIAAVCVLPCLLFPPLLIVPAFLFAISFMKSKYTITLLTNAGSEKALESSNKDLAQRVIAALNQAIAS